MPDDTCHSRGKRTTHVDKDSTIICRIYNSLEALGTFLRSSHNAHLCRVALQRGNCSMLQRGALAFSCRSVSSTVSTVAVAVGGSPRSRSNMHRNLLIDLWEPR